MGRALGGEQRARRGLDERPDLLQEQQLLFCLPSLCFFFFLLLVHHGRGPDEGGCGLGCRQENRRGRRGPARGRPLERAEGNAGGGRPVPPAPPSSGRSLQTRASCSAAPLAQCRVSLCGQESTEEEEEEHGEGEPGEGGPAGIAASARAAASRAAAREAAATTAADAHCDSRSGSSKTLSSSASYMRKAADLLPPPVPRPFPPSSSSLPPPLSSSLLPESIHLLRASLTTLFPPASDASMEMA